MGTRSAALLRLPALFSHRRLAVLTLAISVGSVPLSAEKTWSGPLQQRSDTLVKEAGPPRHRGVATLVSEVQIGGAAATADEYMFSNVTEVRPLRDGSVVVVDQGSGIQVFVRVYDASGRYVRTLGRYGQGPGEYSAPSGVAELPDGRIVVRDGRGGRLAAYGSSGEGSQIYSANASGVSTGAGFVTVMTDGTIYLRVSMRLTDGSSPPYRTAAIRLWPDGTVIDTVYPPRLPTVGPPPLSATRTTANGYSSTSAEVPFTPVMLSALSPRGYTITVNTGRYAVDLLQPIAAVAPGGPPPLWKEGDRVVSIRRSVAPVPVSEAERAESRARIEEQMRRMDPAWRWPGQEIPRVKPPIGSIRVGLDGRIWVRLSTPSERFDPATVPPSSAGRVGFGGGSGAGGAGGGGTPPPTAPPPRTWREPILYDVFDPDGTYIGQVNIPYNTTISATTGDYAWGITRDMDGVPTVHRYRIAWR